MSDKQFENVGKHIATLEKRIESIEKRLARKGFHSNSGYTMGCRCEICRKARVESVRQWRKSK